MIGKKNPVIWHDTLQPIYKWQNNLRSYTVPMVHFQTGNGETESHECKTMKLRNLYRLQVSIGLFLLLIEALFSYLLLHISYILFLLFWLNIYVVKATLFVSCSSLCIFPLTLLGCLLFLPCPSMYICGKAKAQRALAQPLGSNKNNTNTFESSSSVGWNRRVDI